MTPHLVAVIAALALSACTTPAEPVIRVVETKVIVPVKCGTDPGPPPTFSDSQAALRGAADIFEGVRLLLAGRAQRDARLAEVGAAFAGCR